MSALRRNLAANLAGTVWSALLTLLVIPVYLRRLGPELYGIVAFQVTVQSLTVFLDFGLGAAANREIARLSAGGSHAPAVRRLVITLELLYWSGAVLIATGVILAAPHLTTHWFHPVHMSTRAMARALSAMALVLSLQFPYALYSGVLLGLQRHVQLNACVIAGTTLRLLLPIAVIAVTGPNVAAFFVAQAAGAAVQTLSARALARAGLPRSTERVRPKLSELRRVRSYAVGISAFMLLSGFVTQMDKLVVSRFAPLADFAWYSIAATAASGLMLSAVPLFASTFPRFAQLVAASRNDEVQDIFHRSMQFNAAFTIPVAAIMALFPREVLAVWTSNAVVVDRAAGPLSLLAIAMCAVSLTSAAQALQLASGWISFGVVLNGIGVAVLPFAMIGAVARYGPVGAASVAMIWACAAFIITLTYTQRRFLDAGCLSSIGDDLVVPLVATLAVALPARFAVQSLTGTSRAIAVGCAAICCWAAAMAATRVTRNWARDLVRRRSIAPDDDQKV